MAKKETVKNTAANITEATKTVAKKAEKAAETVSKKAEATAEAVAKKAEVTAEAVAKKAPEVETAVKTTAKEAAATVKKAATTAKGSIKETAKKVTPKKVEVVEETYFEFNGVQVNADQIKNQIKEAYKAEGHRLTSIKTLRIYVNANERKAYYVINNDAEGKYIEF